MGKVFAYARVSTPRQGERGVSLIEQRDAIIRYAERHNLEITQWFEERESASKRGRPAFNQMLRLLRTGKTHGVIIHKIDRGARNLEDWNDIGQLVDVGIDVHFATEGIDLKTTAGRLSADIQAVVAAHYSRNLREEVKKGLYGRLKQGFYPFRAPIGYLDQGSAKSKILDPIRAPLIKTAFELYGTGEYSLPTLATELFRQGLRNGGECKISVNGWATILKNPFYVGVMRIIKANETFKGNYQPLISVALFERIQQLLAGKRVNSIKRHVFTYSRIAQCATCKYSLIAEKQKGHIYYRCHNRAFKSPATCPKTSVREEELEDAVLSTLAGLRLNDAEVYLAQKHLDHERGVINERAATMRNALTLRRKQIAARISSLTDLLLDGTIEEPLFQQKRSDLLLQQGSIDEKLREADAGVSANTNHARRAVELAKDASLLYCRASIENKRRLLNILLSNLHVSGKKIEITLSVPFRTIAEREKKDDGGPCRGTCRTWEKIIPDLIKSSQSIPENI
jgi:DNA invertase Pin-like site-specific DNA recombinase